MDYVDAPTEEDLAPRTEGESSAAMRAVYEERRQAEDDALVEALTDRERLIIEEAWSRGANEAREELSKQLVSAHAVTLDAGSVARTVGAWRSTIDATLPWKWKPAVHHDKRVVGIVRYLKAVEEHGR